MKAKIKRISLIISLTLCMFVLCFSFTGCSLQDIFGGGQKSAYQTAVDNGFTGTEEEWLNSFKNGEAGLSLYEEAVKKGYFSGTFEEFMQSHFAGADNGLTIATNLSMRSSVKIVGEKLTGENTKTLSNGSGTIISYNQTTHVAHIATCYHVIVDTSKASTNYALNTIKVFFYGAEDDDYFAHNATFLGGSLFNDVAFLKVTISEEDWNTYHLRVAEFDTSSVALGEDLIVVGNSNGKNLNAVRADVSKQSDETVVTNIDGLSGSSHIHVMRVNAILAHGNSGGGVFNGSSKFVGMINAKSANSEDEANFNYAIPASVVKAIYTNVTNQITGTTTWAMANKYKLGLDLAITDIYTDINSDTGYIYSRDKVMVQTGSIQGLTLNRDILVSATIKRGNEEVASTALNSVYALGELMWYAKSGDVVQIAYKNISTDTIVKADLSVTSSISIGEWRLTYATDLTKC